ncbi:hypothetical protein RA26_02125 [Leisingera sp. ANG-M7]|nr:hypothetical protein RA26_02125 [Leisingera sp. ANG-M7]
MEGGKDTLAGGVSRKSVGITAGWIGRALVRGSAGGNDAAAGFLALTALLRVDSSTALCEPSDMQTLAQNNGTWRQQQITVPA